MNSRERFRETMAYGSPDRVPYFHEGMQGEVIKAWRRQGLPWKADLHDLFSLDHREEIDPDLEPHFRFGKWPSSGKELDRMRRALNPKERGRLPRGWKRLVQQWRTRDHALMLRVHRGFFISMGVHEWKRFKEVIKLTLKDPEFVREAMRIQGEFAASIAERALREVTFDAAVFVEPIAENRGPLISPGMYEDLVLKSYEPLFKVLKRNGVETIIFLTFANPRLLIPSVLKRGFNCLWACEANVKEVDYRELRREFGRDLRLIGGIDLDVLRLDKEAIKREVQDKVPPLLTDGGFIPLADGRVRKDVPFENYVYYRELLEEITQAK